MSRVLITGATGFIGRHLAEELAPSNLVVAVGRRDPEIPGVEWVPVDLATPDFAQHLPVGIESVVHLAAVTDGHGPAASKTRIEVNARSTELLARWSEANGVRTFLLASTGSVYGGGLSRGYREDDPPTHDGDPGSYVSTKIAAEQACRYPSDVVMIVARLFFPYGDNQAAIRLIPRLQRSVAAGDPILIEGVDGTRINPIHISDAVAALSAALGLDVATDINIGGPDVMTIGEIVRMMSARMGRRAVIDHEPDASPRHLVGDISRMSALLGGPHHRLSEDLATGLQTLFAGE